MTREELTEQKVQELFRTPAAGEEGTDGELMQILQRYIFGELCYTGSRPAQLVEGRVLVIVPVEHHHIPPGGVVGQGSGPALGCWGICGV